MENPIDPEEQRQVAAFIAANKHMDDVLARSSAKDLWLTIGHGFEEMQKSGIPDKLLIHTFLIVKAWNYLGEKMEFVSGAAAKELIDTLRLGEE